VHEVPYNMADDGPQRQREYVETLERLLAEGRRGDAAELFMRVAGASEEIIAEARSSPVWPGLEALAHTLAYDAACVGNGQPPTDRLTRITRPTLVLTGGASAESFVGGGGDFFDRAADAIAASVPRARRETLAGQTHIVDPKALAPVLGEVLPGMTSHSSLIPELNAALQRLACARPYVVSEGTLACRETASGRGYTGCMHDTRLRLPAGAGREHLSPRQANGVIHEAAAYRVVG
jgi:hypothetical protein